MPRSRNKFVVPVVAGAAVVGAWLLGSRLMSDDDSAASAARHAVNHVWIERLPADARDMIHHFTLVKHPQGRIGALGKSSQWRHHVELFKWGLEGERLQVYLPQVDAKLALRVKTWECDGEAPDPFELCMTIDTGKRKLQYYSRKDWVVEPANVAASLDALVEAYPELAGVQPSSLTISSEAEGDAAEADAIEVDADAILGG